MDEINEIKRRAGVIREANLVGIRQIMQSTLNYLTRMQSEGTDKVPIKTVITFFQDALNNLPPDCD